MRATDESIVMQKPKRYYWWQRGFAGADGAGWEALSQENKDRLAYQSNRVWGGVAVYLMVSCVIALFAPLDILSYPWARDIVAMTASVAPVILNVPSQSPIPDVVRFYFGVTWLIMPLFVAWELFWTNFQLRERVTSLLISQELVKDAMKSRFSYTAALLVVGLMVMGMFHTLLTELYKVSSWQSRMLWQSRYTLLIAGTLTNMIFVYLGPMMLASIRTLQIAWPYLPWLRRRKQS